MARLGIVGSGAWGTTLGVLAAANGHRVHCLGRDAAQMAAFNASHANLAYLPEFPLPPALIFTSDPAAALDEADVIVLAVPSEHMEQVVGHLHAWLSVPDRPLCSATKGFVDDRLTRVCPALAGWLGPHPLAALSGPNLAKEVLRGDPTVTVIAAEDESTITRLQEFFARPTFRIYGSHDLIGVELGGAVKNILALAAGISRQLGFGMNTQAALLSRGMAEMATLGKHLGAQRDTLMGIAGLGDAVCTCLSPLSRNVQLGMRLAQGETLASAIEDVIGVAEGITTARHVAAYAKVHQLDLPITAGVAAVVDNRAGVREVVDSLMERTWKMEGA